MERARETSRADTRDGERMELPPDAMAKLAALHIHATDDSARDLGHPMRARIRALWDGKHFRESLATGHVGGIVLDRTCFFAESGGQEADAGDIRTSAQRGARGDAAGHFEVRDVQRFGDYVLHIGRVAHGVVHVDSDAEVMLKHERRECLRANHTATHLLNLALRTAMGEDVQQRGSLVAADRLRFDFASARALTAGEAQQVESQVNAAIAADLPVSIATLPLAHAKKIRGVRAVFGERYPDPVRVVSIGATVADLDRNPDDPRWGSLSIEFCGGTHLASTGSAKSFVLVSEGASAAGVRRCFGLTGSAAIQAAETASQFSARVDAALRLEGDALLTEAADIARAEASLTIGLCARHALAPRLESLRERTKDARRKMEGSTRDEAVTQVRALTEAHIAGDARRPLVAVIRGADAAALIAALDSSRAQLPETPILLLSPDVESGKVAIAATSPAWAIAKGLKAGEWVRTTAQACGGSGGGKPDTAQAGGKDVTKVTEAVDAARAFAANR
jgi:alanyl-tRNA synthetase